MLLCLILGLVAALLYWLSLQAPEVTISRQVPPHGFEGTSVPYSVWVRVHSRWPLRVQLEDPTPLSVVSSEQYMLGGLTIGETLDEMHSQLMLNRRGEFSWPGGTLRWADPLGLFWHVRQLHCPDHIEVYPGTHGLQLPDLLRPLLSEGTLSRTLGLEDPISLRGARPYVNGDPPGRIHWRLSARSGELTVRELDKTASSSLALYLDTHGSDTYIESAVRLGSSLIQEALSMQLPVSLLQRQSATPSGRTPEALRAALRALASVQPSTNSPSTEPPVIYPPRPGSNLIILTQSAGAELVQQAMRARATASRVVIVAMPEGFYLEPGENPRRQWAGAPDTIRELERQAGFLAGAGIVVYVLRGNQSVLRLGA